MYFKYFKSNCRSSIWCFINRKKTNISNLSPNNDLLILNDANKDLLVLPSKLTKNAAQVKWEINFLPTLAPLLLIIDDGLRFVVFSPRFYTKSHLSNRNLLPILRCYFSSRLIWGLTIWTRECFGVFNTLCFRMISRMLNPLVWHLQYRIWVLIMWVVWY